MTNTIQLYSLNLKDVKTYIFAALFIAGNIVLPQLCHTIHNGGFIFLPIYFFTLVGAYKYGWKVGILTALGSPLINHLLFGMPPVAVLPSILIKSCLLALAASYAAHKFKKVSVFLLFAVVLAYQITGCLIESGLYGSLAQGFQDFRLGIPGMLIQVFVGYVVIRYLFKK